MIRVQTGSRVHFGLLNFGTVNNRSSGTFGGVGLMVQQPGITLELYPAKTWSADGPLAERALAFASMILPTLPPDIVQPQHIHIGQAAPEHMGLGTGTQLGLAVASAVVHAFSLKDIPVTELACRVNRGQRTALGVHGFAQGGFLVDAGKSDSEAVAPLVARVDFPEPWRIILMLPCGRKGLHGDLETKAFNRLRRFPYHDAADNLFRQIHCDMLPALKDGDYQTFGEAVFNFNRRVGETFASVQGGTYSNPQNSDLVQFIRSQGIPGAGQSSWGPGVFAIAKDEPQAESLAQSICNRFGFQMEVIVTAAQNRGALVERIQ
ncbi:MAG TPA: beta-ribofuranosylaminobenzene 5'-phosphate synthase family protein [Gemmataceae bacterium]|jgi:beta-RFAP synthase|nr:beta-ribofuranosylaminobenzene 5'-phosphate synthase family protein [Gemmataceae bacterium]